MRNPYNWLVCRKLTEGFHSAPEAATVAVSGSALYGSGTIQSARYRRRDAMAMVPQVCDFGWKAADAALPGIEGRTHRIFDQAGPNGLVVAFICNHCPYVKAVIGRIVRDAADLKQHGIGFVAISSNDAETYPDDSFPEMKLFAARNGFAFPYLHDEDQAVARTYDAACTPDFFGFNAELELQ